MRVADWTVPDRQDYRTWLDIIQSPDALALEYNVPRWSEKHWEMIAESFRLIGQTGCRIVYVPLLAHSHLGNEESMVRWVKKADGTWDYDYSILEKYLDVAEKNMGRPKVIVFVTWDVYMLPKNASMEPYANASRVKQQAENLEKVGGEYGIGPMVTVLDPGTQKTEMMKLPVLTAEGSLGAWKGMFDGLRVRLKKRGLEGAAMIGTLHDAWATKADVQVLKEATGNLPWVIQSHGGPKEGQLLYGIAPIGYQAVVWDVKFSDDGADYHGKGEGLNASLHGWTRKVLWSQFERWTRENHPCTRWRTQAEVCITGDQRGPGRLGGEYWRVMRDKRGNRMGRVYQQYPESDWRNLVIADALLAPGPDGAVMTNQMEAMREGMQECEAIIVIEGALIDEGLRKKLGEDLVKRCETTLTARHRMLWLSLSSLQFYYNRPGGRSWETSCMAKAWRNGGNVTGHYWLLGSGYQERNADLYDLAGAVTRACGR